MASYRPYIRPRTAVLLILAIFAFCCWIEPCDGHSCDNQETHSP